MTPEAAVAEVMAALEAEGLPGPVVVAVSGGGDSTALLHAAVAAGGRTVIAATVDHGLRPEAAAEAEGVARACAALGLAHGTLRWDGGGTGNLQARARDARRRLIGAWARERGAATVLLGHTADDQAETVLLALARGSGVDGLAGMPATFAAEGQRWDRPFLGIGREELRDWLRARGLSWVEDPSNEDERFARVRARRMAGALAGLGLTRGRLVRTAAHLGRAQATLDAAAAEVAARVARAEGADLLLPLSLVAGIERGDTGGRLLSAALRWVGGRERRPRWEDLLRLAAALREGRPATLAGCRLRPEGADLRLSPEPGRARPRERGGLDFARFVALGARDEAD